MKSYENHQIRQTVSNRKSKKHSVAFFERGSWYHRTKSLDEKGNIKYGKKGGFSTQKEAEDDYWLCLEEFEKSRLLVCEDVGSITLGDYLKKWFENDFSPNIQNTTRMVMAHMIYNIILPNIKNDIKLSLVNVDYLDALLLECSKCSASSGNKCREVLNIAFKHALIEGDINNNPMPSTKLYKRPKVKITVYNKQQIKKFLNDASKSSWYFEILLALFCGLRKGEILGLKFSDFDIENETVTISRQIVANPIISPNSGSKITEYEIVERPPKTPNSMRKLKVPAVVIVEMKKRFDLIETNKKKLGDEYKDFDYVSCQKNGRPHSLSAFNIALGKICKKAGLPSVTVHGLRHMYATILIENGASLSKISALLGHSSINTTFEYYCDVSDEDHNIKAFIDNTFIPKGGI